LPVSVSKSGCRQKENPSILGVIAIKLHSLQLRKKEIAVIKILGTSNWLLLRILVKRFIDTAIIAVTLAFPIVWYLSKQWLSRFND